jgi:hypothetical protein
MRDQSKEIKQANLMVAMIGGAPKAQKTLLVKKSKKPFLFKFKKPRHLARSCLELSLGPRS